MTPPSLSPLRVNGALLNVLNRRYEYADKYRRIAGLVFRDCSFEVREGGWTVRDLLCVKYYGPP